MDWTYEDELVTELPDIFGFIYLLTYEDKSRYIGKKSLETTKVIVAKKDGSKREGHIEFKNRHILVKDDGNIAVSKKDKADLRKRKVKATRIVYEVISSESSWKSYEGSHDKPKAKLVSKEIIDIALNKAQLSYKEEYHLFTNKCLEVDGYLNITIGNRYFKGKL